MNTLQAYAWPIERWTDRAAGGTSQRLQPGGATVRDRSRNPGVMDRTIGSGDADGQRRDTGFRRLYADCDQGGVAAGVEPNEGVEDDTGVSFFIFAAK